MTAKEVLDELKVLSNESTKKTLMNHGAREPIFGVKVEDLKKIQKRVKRDHELALALYDSGVSDAMYLAGLITDDARMSKKDLNRWAKQAYWSMISEYTVAWVAAESPHGKELALEWIDSKQENVASSGWSTLSSLVSIKPDTDLDLAELTRLLDRVVKTIHDQPNRVRHTMNCFVIAVGSYVATLTNAALKAADQIGIVQVDMGGTACKEPPARAYIEKVQARGSIGKKRKTAKC